MYTSLRSALFLFLASAMCVVASSWIQKYQPDFYQLEMSPLKTSLIHDCSDRSYILDIKDITLKPAQPVPGEELIIEAIGYLKEPVDFGAEADVLVKLGLVTLLKKSFDLCEEMENNNAEVQCPVADGLVKVTQKVMLPKEIPKAHFKVQVRAVNYNDHPLACLNIDVDFRHHFWRSLSPKKNRLPSDADW